MAQVVQKEVKDPVVVAPPNTLVTKSVNENGAGFMVHGVIIWMVTCAGVVFVLFDREPHAEIDPNVLQSVHRRAVAFVAGGGKMGPF